MAKLVLETEYGMRVIRNDLPEDVKNDDIYIGKILWKMRCAIWSIQKSRRMNMNR